MKKKMLDQEEDEEDRGERWAPDFHWMTEHVAVGGCFPKDRIQQLATDHGIGAVVDLRGEDCDDEEALREAGIELLHLPTPDMESAVPEFLKTGVQFVSERVRAGDKVLIHCQHGIGRSALLALCVLVDEGREPIEALEHAKARRELISLSHAQYLGWADWLRERGLTAPDYHSFGCIMYRHLAQG
jgi:protein-tyrosine phosphatase